MLIPFNAQDSIKDISELKEEITEIEKELIKIGKKELKALAVPGHSPGSMVFYCEAQHCMYSGDL